MQEQKFLTIDIGSAWSKAFLVSVDSENKLEVEKSSRLPTSWGDLPYVIGELKKKISAEKLQTIYVSHLPEVEAIAAKEKVDFVSEKDAAEALAKFFKKSDSFLTILDGGASNLHENIEPETIGKFLTFQSSSIFLENFFGKRRFRAHILPTDTKELEIEEAFLRSIFQNKFTDTPVNKKLLVLVTGGVLSGSPRLSRLALLILDTLGSDVTAQILFDREFFLPCFGALLAKYKQVHMVTTGSWLEDLGAFISLGDSKKIELDWGFSQVQQVELSDGEISLIPAPKEQKIKLSVFLSKKEKKEHTVNGGNLGIVLDARSRPLPLTFGQADSRNLMSKWFKELEQAEINKEVF